ncbi:hypothetical protein [Clostridium gasigenes]|uniref:hypothetical protein n=1 Tax=Clostridium gasigenes TaxID=94869 RepID=UPI001C0DED60|nr:hypothetical protein [Clostridium gasigenes]MBU3103756.1 hypothetical protein [Clostridium gasigenes]MBU3108292.1 hypothetical protein [Clostridium gasigenes]MBU3136671.1 hypothetical protein [Clostridium gasigenes]
MGMDELESKMKRLYNDIKSGEVTKEIAQEATEAMHGIEKMGGEAKEKFGGMMDDMKDGLKKIKNKF